MAIRDVYRCVVLLAACFAVPAEGQRLIVLPGAASSASTAAAYSAAPFASAGTINAGAHAFLAFGDQAGLRFFIVTTSGVTVVDTTGVQTQAPLAIPETVSGAAVTPDGKKLVVVSGSSSSGSATIFDVSGAAVTQIAAVTVGSNPQDVAISPDSGTAYVVDTAGVTPVNLTANTAGTAVPLAGLTPTGAAKPGITVGWNGLLYVNARSAIYELHPSTLATLNTISIGGFPGKLNFSSDGTAAAVWNQTSGDPRIASVNLATHTLTASLSHSRFGGDWTFTSAAFANGDQTIYWVSTDFGYVYSSTRALGGFSAATFPVIGSLSGVSALATSGESGTPHYLFAVGSGGAKRVDLRPSPAVPVTVAMTTPAGPVFYVAPAVTGGLDSVVAFNSTQGVKPSAVAWPLVVRLLDANGSPLVNQRVVWAPNASVSMQTSMAKTNVNGIAVAMVTAPSSDGAYAVTASFPGTGVSDAVFALNVSAAGGGGEGGGGGGGTTGGVSIVSGNGQASSVGNQTAEPLVVAVKDASGTAVAGASVTFSASNGNLGKSTDSTHGQDACVYNSTGGLVCTANSQGLASVFYQSPNPIGTGASYQTQAITASTATVGSTAGGSVTFTETSVASSILVTALAPTGGSPTITGEAGQTLKGALQMQVQFPTGPLPIPGVGMTVRPTFQYAFGVTSSPASCVGPGGVALSNANGIATCDLVLGRQPGTYQMYRIAGGYDVQPFLLVITRATPVATTITKTNDNQTAPVGQTLTLTATVVDQLGSVMASTPVVWSKLSGTAALVSPGTTTNAQGNTSTSVRLDGAGAIQVKVTSGSASAIFNLTATVVVGSVTKTKGEPQSAAENTAFGIPLEVLVKDAQGGVVTGIPVVFAKTQGSATLSAASVVTDANGKASVTVTAGATPGDVKVTATAGGITQTFTITVLAPGPQLTAGSFLNGASFLPGPFVNGVSQPGFSPGSIVTVMAPGLASGLSLAAGNCLSEGTVLGALPTRVAGVEFQFGDKLAPIFAICLGEDGTTGQANLQVPFELGAGKVGVVVRYGAGTSSPSEFHMNDLSVLSASPGIFEYPVDASTKLAVALRQDGSVVSASNPAKQGDTIRVYTTGLGLVLPSEKTNQIGFPGQRPYFTPTVKLGGADLGGVTAEYAENIIGIFVVTFQIPSTQAVGNAVELVIGAVTDKGTGNIPYTSQISHIAIASK
jgi:uncharacterized protein (TIGR03437 family)